MKIEPRDPRELRAHPLRKKITLDAHDDAGWNAFVDGLSAAGPDGIPPLFITQDGRILDGFRRWSGAKQLGWEQIGCIVRPEEDAAAIIVESLVGQRNMSAGTKVYCALFILREFVESTEHRRVMHLKNGVKTLEKALSSNSTAPESLRSLAEKFGVHHETVRRAQAVHKLFSDHAEIKAEWEPKLLSGEKNLWNVISGTAGAAPQHQAGRERGVAESQLELFEGALGTLKTTGKTWKKLDPQRQRLLAEEILETVKAWPAELRETFKLALEESE